MEKSLEELKNLSNEKFEIEYNKYHGVLIGARDLIRNTSRNGFRSKTDSSLVNVHCRDCSKKLFNAKHLKYREPSYICVSEEFTEKHIEIDFQSRKFKCSEKSCNKELGRLIEMRNSSPLYMIDIKGVKFYLPSNEVKPFSQWILVRDYIDIDNYS